MAVAGFLTPMLEKPKVPVHRWIALQAELLREAASRGVPAATAVLRFAGLIPDSLGAVADLDRGLDLDTARLAIAKDHWYPDLADALAHGTTNWTRGSKPPPMRSIPATSTLCGGCWMHHPRSCECSRRSRTARHCSTT
jgi:hypothetical protein